MPLGEPKCSTCGGELLSGAVHICRFECSECESLRRRLASCNESYQRMLEDRTKRVDDLKAELAAAERRFRLLLEPVTLALTLHAHTGCKDGCWFPKDVLDAAVQASTKGLVCICADFDPDAERCIRCGGKIG